MFRNYAFHGLSPSVSKSIFRMLTFRERSSLYHGGNTQYQIAFRSNELQCSRNIGILRTDLDGDKIE